MAKIIFIEGQFSWKTTSLFEFLYENRNVPYEYENFFLDEKTAEVIKEISDTLQKESKTLTIYPPINNTFRAFRTRKPKAVILGMDPYHNYGSACGLCFSLPRDVDSINPSMRSIQKEVASNGFKVNTDSGDVSNWADDGVLLLNTALSVQEGAAGSHLKIC